MLIILRYCDVALSIYRFTSSTLRQNRIGDVLTSIIATASWAGTNIFDYLNILQREQDAVKLAPENYLPWNYQK